MEIKRLTIEGQIEEKYISLADHLQTLAVKDTEIAELRWEVGTTKQAFMKACSYIAESGCPCDDWGEEMYPEDCTTHPDDECGHLRRDCWMKYYLAKAAALPPSCEK